MNNNEEKDFLDKYKKQLSELKNMDKNECIAPDLLYRYFNNEVAEEETIQHIEDHLDQCSICLATLEELQQNHEADISLPKKRNA